MVSNHSVAGSNPAGRTKRYMIGLFGETIKYLIDSYKSSQLDGQIKDRIAKLSDEQIRAEYKNSVKEAKRLAEQNQKIKAWLGASERVRRKTYQSVQEEIIKNTDLHFHIINAQYYLAEARKRKIKL